MVAPGSTSARPQPLRCDHCGRAVRETEHTRSAYRVDYYSLHTGEVELCSLAAEDGERRVTFQRLVTVAEVITCTDCYRDASVQEERERRFRPERGAEEVSRE